MNARIFACILKVLLSLAWLLPAGAEQPLTFPEPKLLLKGLTEISVRATSTEDARKALKSIGQSSSGIEGHMVSVAREQLADVGIKVDKQTSKAKAELLFTIFTELTTGTVKIALNLNEMVSILRPSDCKVLVTTWQRQANPRSNEDKPMTATASQLTEQFLQEWLEANPRGKR